MFRNLRISPPTPVNKKQAASQCKLKNGATVSLKDVNYTMSSINSLATSGDLKKVFSIYALALKAQNAKDVLSSEVSVILKESELLQQNDTLADSVINIIKAAISMEDDAPLIGDPVIENIEE